MKANMSVNSSTARGSMASANAFSSKFCSIELNCYYSHRGIVGSKWSESKDSCNKFNAKFDFLAV